MKEEPLFVSGILGIFCFSFTFGFVMAVTSSGTVGLDLCLFQARMNQTARSYQRSSHLPGFNLQDKRNLCPADTRVAVLSSCPNHSWDVTARHKNSWERERFFALLLLGLCAHFGGGTGWTLYPPLSTSFMSLSPSSTGNLIFGLDVIEDDPFPGLILHFLVLQAVSLSILEPPQ